MFTFQDFAEEVIRVNDPTARPLANLQRRRRRDSEPRTPFGDAGRARQALAEDGVVIAGLAQSHLLSLARLNQIIEVGS